MSPTRKQKKDKPVDEQRLRNYALWLLGGQVGRDYTERALRLKLKFKYPEGEPFIDRVIEYLKERSYINDERFLELSVSRLLGQRKGLNKIRQTLLQKGFSSALIDEALKEDKVQQHTFLDDAIYLKQRKFGLRPIEDTKAKQKALRYLLGKGYSFELAKKAISHQSCDECGAQIA